MDAAVSFRDALTGAPESATPLGEAWTAAALVATARADDTAQLRPKKGRARPLGERSVGHPDPGAVSFALIVEAVAISCCSRRRTWGLRDCGA